MARPNPVQLENFFNETIRLIESAPSERVQLQLIAAFLDRVKGYEKENESYLIQIFQKLPDFSSPLLYAGLNPNYLKDILEQLERCIFLVDQPEEQVEIEQLVFSYKKAMSQLYKWVGEDDHSEVLQDAIVVSEGRDQEQDSNGVLVPVVEQSGELRTGRLRRLKVEIIGASKQKFEIRPTFGVIGAEAGSFLEAAETAAGDLLNESRKGKNKYWIGTAVFDLSHAWHAGRSANLAVAGCYYCEMLRAEELQEYFRLNPAICVTGDLDNSGNVLAVEESSLLQKAEAAFFSWAHVLVVPADQLLQTLQIIEQLKTEFPYRELPVVGVTHIRELFFDRRLTLHHKTGTIAHNLKKAWKRKFSMAGVLLVLALLLIIGRLVYGPVDRNPKYATYEGEYAQIRNEQGSILEEIYVGSVYVDYVSSANPYEVTDHLKFIDMDGDRENEIFENKTVALNEEGELESVFLIRELNGDTLFSKEFLLDVRFDSHPFLQEELYTVQRFSYQDLNMDGTPELLMLVAVHSYFIHMFISVDIYSSEITNAYVNAGYIRDFIVRDIDENGIDEIILLVEMKGFDSAGIVLLDSRNFDGVGILGDRYKKTDVKKVEEMSAILIPQTIVGKKLNQIKSPDRTYGGLPIAFRKSNKNLITVINDEFNSKGELNASLFFNFFQDMTIKSIISMDNYDIWGKRLIENGDLIIEPNAVFLDSYRDSLRYWNGTGFQSKPTLNRKYLELVGEDSIFYLNHYFQRKN